MQGQVMSEETPDSLENVRAEKLRRIEGLGLDPWGQRFDDPVPIINSLVPEVRDKGADVIVVLAHIGGNVDQNGVPSGQIFDLARGVDALASTNAIHLFASIPTPCTTLLPCHCYRSK